MNRWKNIGIDENIVKTGIQFDVSLIDYILRATA